MADEHFTAKLCPDCLRVKPIEEFHKTKEGLSIGCWRPACKPCFNARNRIYVKNHPEERRLINKQAHLKISKEKLALYRRKSYVRKCFKADPTIRADNEYRIIRPFRNETKVQRCRRYTLKNSWGLTLAQYEVMFEAQGRKCAICGGEKSNGKSEHFVIDHCHSSKKIRALLCSPCNLAIGLVKESVPVLEKMIRYLKKHSSGSSSS